MSICDDRRPCFGLPPFTIITPSVKIWQLVEPVYDIWIEDEKAQRERNEHLDEVKTAANQMRQLSERSLFL
ncbi:hypothetical protein TNCV_3807681 [Trichonephila clavipes]|nr:hypothetical protein TNCV_3807681 [Trichonephila clavipes]